jgi:hypothetical protein
MVLFLSDALSDKRMGLSFVYAAGPCQRSLSWVRGPWDSQSYLTVSEFKLPFRRLIFTKENYCTINCCCRDVFTAPYGSNGRCADQRIHRFQQFFCCSVLIRCRGNLFCLRSLLAFWTGWPLSIILSPLSLQLLYLCCPVILNDSNMSLIIQSDLSLLPGCPQTVNLLLKQNF